MRFLRYLIMTTAHSNCHKILIVFADILEANAIFSMLTFTPVSSHLYRYQNPLMILDVLILKQWGKKGVMEAFSSYPCDSDHYSVCINLGFAGAASSSFPLGKCYSIESIQQLNTHSLPKLHLSPLSAFPIARLTTVSSPYREGFQDDLELIDMEGYTIASLCKQRALPCLMMKITSDYTTKEGGRYLQEHKEELSFCLVSSFLASLQQVVAYIHDNDPEVSTKS